MIKLEPYDKFSGRYYFIGTEWLVLKMKEVYGNSIDYYIQQKIPTR